MSDPTTTDPTTTPPVDSPTVTPPPVDDRVLLIENAVPRSDNTYARCKLMWSPSGGAPTYLVSVDGADYTVPREVYLDVIASGIRS